MIAPPPDRGEKVPNPPATPPNGVVVNAAVGVRYTYGLVVRLKLSKFCQTRPLQNLADPGGFMPTDGNPITLAVCIEDEVILGYANWPDADTIAVGWEAVPTNLFAQDGSTVFPFQGWILQKNAANDGFTMLRTAF